MKAVILAGGLGKRVRPYTLFLPKPMLPLGDKPILGHIIDWIKKQRIKEIIICVSYMSEIIEEHFGNGEKYGVKIGFADHVTGENEDAMILPLMALAKGAVLIEKHLTINRNEKWIDYHSALNADEFVKFVKQIKRLAPLLAMSNKVTPSELSYRKI